MNAVLAEAGGRGAWLEPLFDVAFTAPNGVARLRQLILTLAMQGKLVPQDPTDVPAAELLEQIAAEKATLVKAGKIRAPKPLEPIAEAEKPYGIPAGWEWVRLGEIGVWKSGTTPSRTNSKYYGGKIPWVKSGEVKQGRIIATEESITPLALEKCSLHLNPKGSVLVAMYGANIGEVGILDIEATTNQAVCACQTFTKIDERYLLNLISSLKPHFIAQGAGAAQPNISREKIIATVVPLPPLAEQKRIVARIDELMSRCDKLESLRSAQDSKRRGAGAATVRQWLAGDDAAAVLLGEHFATLVSTRDDVAELRKAILQSAVMGKLVSQDASDVPASELLKQIAAKKAALVKAGRIRTPKPLKSIENAEKPYAIPVGWEWVRFGELVEVLNGRAYKQNELLDKGTPVLRVGNLFTSKHWYYSNIELEDDKYIDRGDLIYAWSASFGPFIWDGERVIYHYHIWKLRFFVEGSPVKRFLYNFLMNETEAIKSSGNGIAMLHMTKERMEKLSVPLPPLAEQKRIVTRIDTLMHLCDTLEQGIDTAQAKQTELLGAVMARAY